MSWTPTGIAERTVRPGLPQEILHDGRSIVLVRLGTNLHALEGTCPHTGGLLVDGTLEEDRLICPVHGATFGVRDGKVRADPGGVVPPQGGVDALAVYPVRIVDGLVELDL
jgi:nitrite reductase/ring-hydroxylating ferredoxin subunit